MSHVPYVSDVGSLMYAMVCVRLDIVDAMRVLSMYMSKLGKELDSYKEGLQISMAL